MSVDQETKKRLALAKRLLIHGINHVNDGTTLSRMIAIHNFDNAIELLLKRIGTKYNVEHGRIYDQRFKDIWNEINIALDPDGLKLPLKHEIFEIHELRNHAQHYGLSPSQDKIEKAKVFSEEFFRRVITEIFGISYDGLSLAILIEDNNVRDLFIKFEEMFGKEEYKESLKFLATAFAIAERNTLRKISKAFYSFPKMIDLPDGKRIDISDCFNDLYETISTLKLGIDYKKYWRFKEVTPMVHAYGRPTFSLITGKVESPLVGYVTEKSRNPERENVIFCFEFALESILEWQKLC